MVTAESTCRFNRGPKFSSQHSDNGAQLALIPVLGVRTPFSSILGHAAGTWYTDKHAGAHTYTFKKIKLVCWHAPLIPVHGRQRQVDV